MELYQQLVAAGLALAFLFLAVAAAHRRGWLRTSFPLRRRVVCSLELLERLSLTPQHQLHLLRINGRTLLLATYPQGVEVVDTTGSADVARGASV